jgi:hypothetical protein
MVQVSPQFMVKRLRVVVLLDTLSRRAQRSPFTRQYKIRLGRGMER